MAPVATELDRSGSNGANIQDLKAKFAKSNDDKAYNPFYSPPDADDGDDDYEYSQYKARTLLLTYLGATHLTGIPPL